MRPGAVKYVETKHILIILLSCKVLNLVLNKNGQSNPVHQSSKRRKQETQS